MHVVAAQFITSLAATMARVQLGHWIDVQLDGFMWPVSVLICCAGICATVVVMNKPRSV